MNDKCKSPPVDLSKAKALNGHWLIRSSSVCRFNGEMNEMNGRKLFTINLLWWVRCRGRPEGHSPTEEPGWAVSFSAACAASGTGCRCAIDPLLALMTKHPKTTSLPPANSFKLDSKFQINCQIGLPGSPNFKIR